MRSVDNLMKARCLDCDHEYPSVAGADADLCPDCQELEDAVFALDPIPEPEPRPYSKAWMRERLSVAGDVDE